MRPTGHIRQRTEGSWEIRYSLGRSSETGKRRVATVTLRGTRKDAERELRRLLRTLDTGEHVDPTRKTVAQWLRDWLDAIREEISPKSHERYSELVENFLILELGSLPIAKLAPSHVQAAYATWAVGGRRDGREGGLSPRTRRHLHRILRSALTRAADLQVIARNPTDPLRKRLPKVERREMGVLSTEQSKQLLDAIKHTRVYWPCLLAIATGMRRGEVLALRWNKLDFENGIVRVVESLEQTKAGLRFKAPKTERTRSITLPRYAINELRRLKREQAEQLLALGIRQNGETLVCGRADGKPHQPRSLTHEFTHLIRRIEGLPRVRFHDLRHSHATQLLAAGVHPKVAQERLGHSSVAVTLDIYSHVTGTMQADAAERLDAEFQRATNRATGTE